MAYPQIVRHVDAADLAHRGASRLLERLLEIQTAQKTVSLCLTGGQTALSLYGELGKMLPNSPLDPSRLELWWADDLYTESTNPQRLASIALAVFASHFPVDPACTHPIPGSEGFLDSTAVADSYAKELGQTHFDICILGIGALGQVASLFPGHPETYSEKTVVPIIDAPIEPVERITLTVPSLSNSSEVWFVASGYSKTKAVTQALIDPEETLANRICGEETTCWLIDQAAASEIPYHVCNP